MVNNKQINAFINYNYIPFNKKQCIKRIILIWLFSAMLSIISNMKVFWILLLGCIDLVQGEQPCKENISCY